MDMPALFLENIKTLSSSEILEAYRIFKPVGQKDTEIDYWASLGSIYNNLIKFSDESLWVAGASIHYEDIRDISVSARPIRKEF